METAKLVLLLVCTLTCFSSVTSQNPNITSSNIPWTILDGSRVWIGAGVDFLNETTGFVASFGGIWKTTDGGQTFVEQDKKPTTLIPFPALGDIAMHNETSGVAGGLEVIAFTWQALYTTDGDVWLYVEDHNFGPYALVRKCDATNDGALFQIGQWAGLPNYNGFQVSNDSGVTWTEVAWNVTNPISGAPIAVESGSFFSETEGYLIGSVPVVSFDEKRLRKSRDSYREFVLESAANNPYLQWKKSGAPNTDLCGSLQRLTYQKGHYVSQTTQDVGSWYADISCHEASQTCWLVGAVFTSHNPTFFIARDGPNDERYQTALLVDFPLTRIKAYSQDLIWAAGSNGTHSYFLHTTTGSHLPTWYISPLLPNFSVQSLSVASPNVVYAGGINVRGDGVVAKWNATEPMDVAPSHEVPRTG